MVRFAAPQYDVVVSAKNPLAAGLEIATHLGTRGFCVVDPGLGTEVFRQACSEVEGFTNAGRLSQPPSLICEGLLGAEGSAQILHLEKLSATEAPNLMRIDAALTEMAVLIGGTLPALGFQCPQRTMGVVHETGLPQEEAPELTEHEAAAWLPSFTRAKIMMLAILGPIKGTLELNPFEEETEPFEVSTLPGTVVLLRADIMSHKHFAHSRVHLVSCFLLEGKPTGKKEEAIQNANMPPYALELESWTIQRLKELKEEEAETGRRIAVPEGWRSAMDRMFHTEQRCAIRGVAGRFCSTWNCLPWYAAQIQGVDLVTSIPLARWDHEKYYEPNPEGWRFQKTYLKHASFADGLELFDCRFFTLSPMESAGMDPHQRQVLEVGYEACNRAGYKKGKLMNSLGGVYLGSSMTIFGNISEAAGATGGAASINSNRFSYCLGMKGPSMTIDTDAASSLTAVYLAADAVLEKGRGVLNAYSLAGGVYWNLGALFWPQAQAAGLLSAGGRCFTWDASADGYCYGDGCAFVVLKRLTESLDGEQVYIEGENLEGIVASSTLNSNGMSAAMHAPHGPSDQELIAEALRNANISGASIDSVECDGRGTRMSDAVEVDSLARVLRSSVDAEEAAPLSLTSVKSHMGNGMEAAGICSFVRALMGIKFGMLSPNCHLHQVNPYMEPEHKLNYLSEGQDCPFDNMYCGVTAKGFGGTNAHAILFGQPDSVVDAPAPERKHEELWFWPGGGGELEDDKVPFRGYYVVGTWARWEPQPMQSEGEGSFGFTVTLGENRWEEFQVLLDGDRKRRLHPGQQHAPKGSLVAGPDADVQGLNWRISGKRQDLSSPLQELATRGSPVPSLLGKGETSAIPGAVGTSEALAVREPALAADEGQVGDKYRVHLRIAGKYRMVTWEKLAEAPEPASVPVGTYAVTSTWNGWGFTEMARGDDGAWSCEVLLLHEGGEFQVVRNEDWGQVIAPNRPRASAESPGLGPDDGTAARGLTWSLGGSPGDVFRIALQRQADGDTWAVSWERLRTEQLSEDQLAQAQRPRIGVWGSWTGFARQHPLTYDRQEVGRAIYSFYVAIGPEGRESFQLFQELDWSRLVHPDRYVEGSMVPHRVMESANDGSAMDLVWCIGGGSDKANPGDRFKVVVAAVAGKVVHVAWTPAEGADLDRMVIEGRVLQRE